MLALGFMPEEQQEEQNCVAIILVSDVWADRNCDSHPH